MDPTSAAACARHTERPACPSLHQLLSYPSSSGSGGKRALGALKLLCACPYSSFPVSRSMPPRHRRYATLGGFLFIRSVYSRSFVVRKANLCCLPVWLCRHVLLDLLASLAQFHHGFLQKKQSISCQPDASSKGDEGGVVINVLPTQPG